MKNDTLTPQIRFKGFEEEWISKCFGDILISESYKSYLAEPTPNGLYPIIQQGDNPIVGYSNSSPFNEYEDVVLYGDHTTSVYKPLTPFLLSTDGLKMLKASGIIGTFLALSISTYGPKPEGYKRHFSILQTRTCCYPSNRAEQSAIGEYFRRVDELIAEAEREVSRLEKMKQASLQKMFPRPGESVPEVRFAGFTEDWKTVRLGDYASFSRGQGYTKNDLQESGTPIFLYGRLYTKYSTYVESVDTFSHITPSSVMSRGKEIVMPSSGETAEDIAVASAILSKGIILGGGLNIIIPKDGVDSIFLALSLTYGSAHKELAKKAQGKSVVHIYNQDIADLSVSFPESLAEQAAIGEYFRNLDSLIDARRRRVAKLRDIKKACLDKMFAASVPNH